MMRRMPNIVNTVMGYRVIPERFGVTDTSRNGYAWRFAQWASGADDVQWGSFAAMGFRDRRTSAAMQLLLFVYAARCGVTREDGGNGGGGGNGGNGGNGRGGGNGAYVSVDGAGGNMTAPALAKLSSPQFLDVWTALQEAARDVRAQVDQRRDATCFRTENVLELARAFLAAKPPEREFQRYGMQGPTRGSRLFHMCVPVYEDQAGAGATNVRARAQGFAAMKRLSLLAAGLADVAEDLQGLKVRPAPGGALLITTAPGPGPGGGGGPAGPGVPDPPPNRLFAALQERLPGGLPGGP
jgi:hypothetical protein